MTYYRVKEIADGKPQFKILSDNNTCKHNGLYLIENELFTPTERSKLANANWMFQEVEISKKRVHYCFGARFEIGIYPGINGNKHTI